MLVVTLHVDETKIAASEEDISQAINTLLGAPLELPSGATIYLWVHSLDIDKE